jgi:hypothetical protein
MQWGYSIGLNALFIKIDLEKDYNRVEWPFLLAMLKAFGSSSAFIGSVKNPFYRRLNLSLLVLLGASP